MEKDLAKIRIVTCRNMIVGIEETLEFYFKGHFFILAAVKNLLKSLIIK